MSVACLGPVQVMIRVSCHTAGYKSANLEQSFISLISSAIRYPFDHEVFGKKHFENWHPKQLLNNPFPQVLAACVAAASGRAQVGPHGLQSFPNGAVVPVDEPAVAAARADHFAAKAAIAGPLGSAGPAMEQFHHAAGPAGFESFHHAEGPAGEETLHHAAGPAGAQTFHQAAGPAGHKSFHHSEGPAGMETFHHAAGPFGTQSYHHAEGPAGAMESFYHNAGPAGPMERLYMEAQDGLKTIAPPLFLNIFFYFLLV